MSIFLAVIITILIASVLYALYDNARLTFKCSLYEETLKLNKDKFSDKYWEKINEIIEGK